MNALTELIQWMEQRVIALEVNGCVEERSAYRECIFKAQQLQELAADKDGADGQMSSLFTKKLDNEQHKWAVVNRYQIEDTKEMAENWCKEYNVDENEEPYIIVKIIP